MKLMTLNKKIYVYKRISLSITINTREIWTEELKNSSVFFFQTGLRNLQTALDWNISLKFWRILNLHRLTVFRKHSKNWGMLVQRLEKVSFNIFPKSVYRHRPQPSSILQHGDQPSYKEHTFRILQYKQWHF